MRLTDWASHPFDSGPPPIPLSTDVVSAYNPAYAIGAIPPSALAEDLAASGLTYFPGRSNGYRLNGASISRYEAGDVIADIFQTAGYALHNFIHTDPRMVAIGDLEKRLKDYPVRDRDEERDEIRSMLWDQIRALESDLPYTRGDLQLASESLSRRGRLIRNLLRDREEAVSRFRSAIAEPRRSRPASAADISAFLVSVPAGLIERRQLHADATRAGLSVGSITLYRAAAAHGWPLVTINGVRYYRVPETPQ